MYGQPEIRKYRVTIHGRAEFDILEGAEHGDAAFETAENMERVCFMLFCFPQTR